MSDLLNGISQTTWIAIGLDAVTLGLIVLAVWRGYVKGFMKSALHLFSWVLALVFTHLFYPYTLRLFQMTHLTEKIHGATSHLISIPNISGDTTAALQQLPLPSLLKTKLIENNNIEVYRILGVDTLNDYVNAYLSNMIINACAIIATFLFVIILLKIVAILLDIVDHLPVIRQLNHFLGLVFGLGTGVLYVFCFCLLLTLLGASTKLSVLYPAVSKSLVTQIFYNHNILMDAWLRIFGS